MPQPKNEAGKDLRSTQGLLARIATLPPLRPARAGWRWFGDARRRASTTDRGMRSIERRWISEGRPIPPPGPVKHWMVRQAGREHECRVLVETGTYLGDMLLANHRYFDRLVSIELGEELWQRASLRLAHIPHATVLHGDSTAQLSEVVATLTQPTVFWLDAHYSEGITAKGRSETPITEELRVIIEAEWLAGSVVLIDDARCFGIGDYPTLDEVAALIAPRELHVADDVMHFLV
jgi:hypothetical protein